MGKLSDALIALDKDAVLEIVNSDLGGGTRPFGVGR
jgi:hypothetical protein